MFNIINPVPFRQIIAGDLVAFQISDLLNKYNNLKIFHTITTIKADKGTYFVYFDDGKVVGCTAIKEEHPTLTRNYHTCVSFYYRNKHIATKLIKHAESICETQNMFVTIRTDNFPSIALYSNMGYIYIKEEQKNIITLGKRIK